MLDGGALHLNKSQGKVLPLLILPKDSKISEASILRIALVGIAKDLNESLKIFDCVQLFQNSTEIGSIGFGLLIFSLHD